jgi:hypothetical protein
MITDWQGNKVSPKEYARIKLLAAISLASSMVYDDRGSGLTEVEKEKVLGIVKKDADRCARLLGRQESEQA